MTINEASVRTSHEEAAYHLYPIPEHEPLLFAISEVVKFAFRWACLIRRQRGVAVKR
jgi:hypothetical protein